MRVWQKKTRIRWSTRLSSTVSRRRAIARGHFPLLKVKVSVGVHLSQFGALAIVPGGRVGIVGARTRLPEAGRGAHAQGLMGTQLVVFLAEPIQPTLLQPCSRSRPRSRLFQRAVEPLHLALRLRVADAGEATAHTLFHQPYRELGPAVGSTRSPPWHAMIHQHRLGQAVAAKDALQTLAHGFHPRRSRLFQSDQIPAMIIQHGQGTDGRAGSLLPLEVHLPELVGGLALE